MNDNQWSPEEERLSAALHRAADDVTPNPGGLAEIRRRTADGPWWRRPVVWGVVAGVATASTAIVLAIGTLGTSDDDITVHPADETTPAVADDTSTASPQPTTDPDDEATAEPDATDGSQASPTAEADTGGDPVTLPVYYVVDDRLTREWKQLSSDDNPLVTAVNESLNEAALDPRYESLWAPVEVRSADVAGDVIEVDLQGPVELSADPGLAEQAVQQLVYTVTATAAVAVDGVDGSMPVQILVDGNAPEDLFGQLDLTEPVGRADEIGARHLVQIDRPAFGEEVSAPVVVSGVAAVHEANLLWELRRDGEVVDSGFTSTQEAFVFSEYSIELGDLEPGSYEITVSEDDPSGGEGRAPFEETKEFTVVE